MNSFTKTFKDDVQRIADELGLIVTTSSRQEKNGTVELTDPVISNTRHLVVYTLHENGNIRRRHHYPAGTKHPSGFTFKQGYNVAELLNRRKYSKDQYGYRTYKFLPANPTEQLGILTNRVLKYREYLVG